MNSIIQDLRLAWTQLRAKPGHFAIVGLILALDIGASTAIITLVDNFLYEVRPQDSVAFLVVSLTLEGEVRVSNFEMQGARDFDLTAGFVAHRTLAQNLVRGSTNLVSLDRNYIHGSAAGPGGGRGLDITTRIRPRKPGVPYLRLERKRSGHGDLFDAVWTDLAGMKSQDASLLG